MKYLLLIRHAKSSWDFYNDDFDRPLNDRGHKNAPEMAGRLLHKKIKIDAFVSSPAIRAFTTAKYFAETYDVKQKHILTIPALYHAEMETFFSVIEEMKDEYASIALFSHNPGITDFVNGLTDTRIDNMPTCAIFAVKAEADTWRHFRDSQKEFWFFDYPKSVAR